MEGRDEVEHGRNAIFFLRTAVVVVPVVTLEVAAAVVDVVVCVGVVGVALNVALVLPPAVRRHALLPSLKGVIAITIVNLAQRRVQDARHVQELLPASVDAVVLSTAVKATSTISM